MSTYEFNMIGLQNNNMPSKSNYDINKDWKNKNALKEYKNSLRKVDDFPRVYKMPLAETLNNRDIIRQQLAEGDYSTNCGWLYGPYKNAA